MLFIQSVSWSDRAQGKATEVQAPAKATALSSAHLDFISLDSSLTEVINFRKHRGTRDAGQQDDECNDQGRYRLASGFTGLAESDLSSLDKTPQAPLATGKATSQGILVRIFRWIVKDDSSRGPRLPDIQLAEGQRIGTPRIHVKIPYGTGSTLLSTPT